jgi:hypothetical protein
MMKARDGIPVFLLLATFVVFLVLEDRFTSFLGSEQVQKEWPIWLYPLVFSATTFLGVFARSIYEVLNSPKAPKTNKEIFREAVVPNRMLHSLIVSPIVMALFYKTIRASPATFRSRDQSMRKISTSPISINCRQRLSIWLRRKRLKMMPKGPNGEKQRGAGVLAELGHSLFQNRPLA